MILDREQSRACSEELLDLAEALIAYSEAEYKTKGATPELLRDLTLSYFRQIWPFLDVYYGHTHLRVMPFGNAGRWGSGIYIDLEPRSHCIVV